VKARICTPIPARSIAEALKLLEKAEAYGAALAELRIDYLKGLNGVEDLAASTKLPLIATNRQASQGGLWAGSEGERLKRLVKVAGTGFEYADAELTSEGLSGTVHELKAQGVKPIVSHHNFQSTPSLTDIRGLLRREIEAGAYVCKVVTTAREAKDNLTCLTLTGEAGQKCKIVCFAMGSAGILSRVASPLLGAYFTYASVKKGFETARGQLWIGDLMSIYEKLGVET